MSSSIPKHQPPHPASDDDDDDPAPDEAMLDPAEAAEVVPSDDEDDRMDSDNDDEAETTQVELVNDSTRYFDLHKDSIFAIAAHPVHEQLVVTGGGDDVAYIWDSSASDAEEAATLVTELKGHTDSVVATGFSKPQGEYVATGGMDGRIRVWRDRVGEGRIWEFVDGVQEVDEVNWLKWNPARPLLAMGSGEGSVWVYALDGGRMTLQNTFVQHTASCTAGAWTPDGRTLLTASEDGGLYMYDVETGAPVASYSAADERFAMDGGIMSLSVHPAGTVAVVGGANGVCRVISIPREGGTQGGSSSSSSGGGKQKGGKNSSKGPSAPTTSTLLATLPPTSAFSVETISFCASLPLLAVGSVDGSIAIYDAQQHALRRTLRHGADGIEEPAVVQVEFAGSGPFLTSCSMDRTVRRWDARTGQELRSWRGHSEGVLGFVQSRDGTRVVTAGDDGVGLVFELAA